MIPRTGDRNLVTPDPTTSSSNRREGSLSLFEQATLRHSLTLRSVVAVGRMIRPLCPSTRARQGVEIRKPVYMTGGLCMRNRSGEILTSIRRRSHDFLVSIHG